MSDQQLKPLPVANVTLSTDWGVHYVSDQAITHLEKNDYRNFLEPKVTPLSHLLLILTQSDQRLKIPKNATQPVKTEYYLFIIVCYLANYLFK